MAFSQRPRSPPLPHLRNTRLVLRPFPPLVKLATLSWRCSVRATARILSILGNDAVFVQRRPAILTAAPMRHRPSIDGDREMTSEVTPNEASPRETSDSQAALAPCPPTRRFGAFPLYCVVFVCECGFCLRRHRARFYRARYRRRPFAVINLNSLNSTSSRCGMLLVATHHCARAQRRAACLYLPSF